MSFMNLLKNERKIFYDIFRMKDIFNKNIIICKSGKKIKYLLCIILSNRNVEKKYEEIIVNYYSNYEL